MSSELVTMRDIATLARVERPVVSTWRRRYRTSARPFPPPRQHRADQELFSREEVLTWLEETERGNNAAARAEATIGALLSDPRLAKPTYLDALSAVLAVRGMVGEPLTGLDADDLLDVADGLDPDDTFLMRELERGQDLPWLIDAAERLVEASWGVADAHQRLLDAVLATITARTLVTAEAVRLLIAVAIPLLRDLGPDAGLLDPTGSRFDLMPDLAAAAQVPLSLIEGNTRSHRLHRRKLRLSDIAPTVISADDWQAEGPTLSLLVLPDPVHPAATETHLLTLIEDVVVQLTPDQVLLTLAPASLLTDPLAGEPGARRDELLRGGGVRAIVRLPAGFLAGRAREAMALWLVTDADDEDAPADRWTMVADLTRRQLSPGVVDGLATDLLAARLGSEGARLRSWAELHPVATTALLAGGGSLVPPPRTGRLRGDGASGADWAVRLGDEAERRLPGHRLGVAEGQGVQVTLEQARQRGWVQLIAGRRFDTDRLDAEGPSRSVRIWDAAAIASPERPRLADRLELHRHLDPIFTEPGDVVFLARPTPAAVVDDEGGAAVFYPARILRVRPGQPLVPALLALRIRAQRGTDWHAWAVVPLADPAAVTSALAVLTADRRRLLDELADLDRFTTDLTTAVESRRVSLTPKEHHGHPSS